MWWSCFVFCISPGRYSSAVFWRTGVLPAEAGAGNPVDVPRPFGRPLSSAVLIRVLGRRFSVDRRLRKWPD